MKRTGQRRCRVCIVSINAWARKDVMHSPATDCSERTHDREKKDKNTKVTQEGKHTGILTSPFLSFDICAIKEVSMRAWQPLCADLRAALNNVM